MGLALSYIPTEEKFNSKFSVQAVEKLAEERRAQSMNNTRDEVCIR
jgi:hypothetical protein